MIFYYHMHITELSQKRAFFSQNGHNFVPEVMRTTHTGGKALWQLVSCETVGALVETLGSANNGQRRAKLNQCGENSSFILR